jgi:epsin
MFAHPLFVCAQSVTEALLSYSRLSHLEKLRDRFEFKEASGRDQGVNVRQRAGALVSLVQDSSKLAEERDKVCAYHNHG